MYGVLIVFILTFVIKITVMLMSPNLPPAAVNLNSAGAQTYSDEGLANTIAQHIDWYQAQAVEICEFSTCVNGVIPNVQDPVGDTGDYGTNYFSVYNAADEVVATTWEPSGDETDLAGAVGAQLLGLSHHAAQVANYSTSTDDGALVYMTTDTGQTIANLPDAQPNYEATTSDNSTTSALVFYNGAPVMVTHGVIKQ